MRNGILLTLLIAMVALIVTLGPSHSHDDSITVQPPVETTVTMNGVLKENNLQGISGTTPPSNRFIEDGGVYYYLMFDNPTSVTFAPGTVVSVTGTAKITESMTPDGTILQWNVIQVQTIVKSP